MLVPAETVQAMKAGSVIVDLAGETGGNCELSEYGEEVTAHDVTIIAPRNLPSSQPVDASNMYANNVLAVLRHLHPKDELVFDFEDPITDGSIVTHNGEIRRRGESPQGSPPEPPSPNAAPEDSPTPEAQSTSPETKKPEGSEKK